QLAVPAPEVVGEGDVPVRNGAAVVGPAERVQGRVGRADEVVAGHGLGGVIDLPGVGNVDAVIPPPEAGGREVADGLDGVGDGDGVGRAGRRRLHGDRGDLQVGAADRDGHREDVVGVTGAVHLRLVPVDVGDEQQVVLARGRVERDGDAVPGVRDVIDG